MLWVSDFTYVATWQGFVHVAFVIDAFARRIVGWRVSRTAHAGFVLDALEQALHERRPVQGGGLVHRSDRGVQGGFKRSSQHLDGGACDGYAEATFGSGGARRVALAGPARGGAARGPAAVLDRDCGGAVQRGRGARRRGVAGRGGTMVPGGGRHAPSDPCASGQAALWAIPVLRGPGGDRTVACAGAWGSGGCPAAGAGGIDDLARATAQRRDARRRAGVPGHDGAVACRAGGAAPEAGEAGDAPGAEGVCARSDGGCRDLSGRGCGTRTGGAVEGPAAWTEAASALGERMEPAADLAAAAA